LLLEPLGFVHSKGMYALWSSPEVCEHSGVVCDYDRNVLPMPAGSVEVSDKIIDFWLRAAADGWGLRWAILRTDNTAFVGAVGFNSLDSCSELAYHLHPNAWGQGYMGEACEAAMTWVEETVYCSAIEAFIEPANQNSIALARRLGLQADGPVSDGVQRYLS
jgi:ribosomal-protein-alanine N-acetyltransferase